METAASASGIEQGEAAAGRQEEQPGRRPEWTAGLIAALATAFQAVPPALLAALSHAAYGAPDSATARLERPLSLLILGLSGAISLALGAFGAYLLLRFTRPFVAIPLIVVCCLPALLAGALYLYALLVFLTAV
jgi:hypothetical protein